MTFFWSNTFSSHLTMFLEVPSKALPSTKSFSTWDCYSNESCVPASPWKETRQEKERRVSCRPADHASNKKRQEEQRERTRPCLLNMANLFQYFGLVRIWPLHLSNCREGECTWQRLALLWIQSLLTIQTCKQTRLLLSVALKWSNIFYFQLILSEN